VQQRPWSYQEHRPARPWEDPAERRQQRAVGGLQVGPWVLAAQHRKLVAQHQDLDLLGLRRPEAKQDQRKGTAQRQVDERPDHNPSPRGEGKERGRIVVLHHAVPAGQGHDRLVAPTPDNLS
jgi:hypothetical protein